MVKLVEGPDNQQKVLLQSSEGGSVEVFLHGAHVTSWKSNKGEELLFMSNKAIYAPPKAIRGGIPICFPQFGVLGPLGQHGFARNSVFDVSQGSSDSVTLSFRPSTEQQKQFPHQFHLLITVKVGSDSLTQTLEVKNEGRESMPFTTAFHTYFLVSDVDRAHVDLGSEGLTYQDNTKGRAESTLSGSHVQFQQEFDAIFVGAPDTIKVVDEKNGRKISVKKQGLPDAVLWNPWGDKANGMADMGHDQYKNFLCVEPAVAASGPINLPSGQSWSGTQILSLDS
ncbi:hypothetical protein WJX84_012081 [Apatococcus fuscideae]|uniref:glucose-6-phosphate 1-epimerase n=1 Tax=Apatococcus fuscideae TaxID=2026836 RepID=A0AAW1SUN3_9CHLO